MASGKVIWFDKKLGFGFIVEESGQHVFVHYRSILGEGFKTLSVGEAVTFDVVPGDKRPNALNVRRVNQA